MRRRTVMLLFCLAVMRFLRSVSLINILFFFILLTVVIGYAANIVNAFGKVMVVAFSSYHTLPGAETPDYQHAAPPYTGASASVFYNY